MKDDVLCLKIHYIRLLGGKQYIERSNGEHRLPHETGFNLGL